VLAFKPAARLAPAAVQPRLQAFAQRDMHQAEDRLQARLALCVTVLCHGGFRAFARGRCGQPGSQIQREPRRITRHGQQPGRGAVLQARQHARHGAGKVC
jgi:hypothetical protein